MDFKDFKKVGVTKSHTIFEHPEGHVIHVAHEGMPQKLKNEMRQIPVQKLSNGTPDGPLEDPTKNIFPEEDKVEALQQQMYKEQLPKSLPQEELYKSSPEYEQLSKSWGGEENIPPKVIQNLVESGAPGFGSESAKQPQKIQQAQFQQAIPENKNFIPTQKIGTEKEPQMPMVPELGAEAAILGGQEQIRAERGLGEAEAARAINAERAAKQNIIDTKNYEAARQQRYNENKQHVQESIQDFINHPNIDPNRYLGNMGTGQKIMTAIGLLLGGIGAGTAGTENMAMKYLMNTIDKDIEAQKLSLDKKNTIYKANLQMLHDEAQAEEMTRAQVLEMTRLRMQQAALSQGSQIARLMHDKKAGELVAAQEGALNRLSQAQVMNQYAGKTVSSPAVVNMLINTLPKEEQKDARKTYENYTNAGQALDTVVPEMRRIANLGMAGKLFSIQERQNIKQLNQQLIKVSAQLVASPELRARMSKDAVSTLINPYKIDASSFGASDLQKVQNLEKALMEAQSNAADVLGGHRIKVNKPIPQTRLQTIK